MSLRPRSWRNWAWSARARCVSTYGCATISAARASTGCWRRGTRRRLNDPWVSVVDSGHRLRRPLGAGGRPGVLLGGRLDGNPGRVPIPSRDGPRRAKLAGSPRDPNGRAARVHDGLDRRLASWPRGRGQERLLTPPRSHSCRPPDAPSLLLFRASGERPWVLAVAARPARLPGPWFGRAEVFGRHGPWIERQLVNLICVQAHSLWAWAGCRDAGWSSGDWAGRKLDGRGRRDTVCVGIGGCKNIRPKRGKKWRQRKTKATRQDEVARSLALGFWVSVCFAWCHSCPCRLDVVI